MWCERFNIIVTSLHRDFLPASWGTYAPTWVDICLFTGTIGLFSTLFLLFLKFVPAVAVTEIKELRHETGARGHATAPAAGGGRGRTDERRRTATATTSSPSASCWPSSRTTDALLEGTRKMREKGHGRARHPHALSGARHRGGAGAGPGRRSPRSCWAAAITGVRHRPTAMMYFMNAVDFPINVGNRPPHSPPAFIPITFELAVLLGGTSAFFGRCWACSSSPALPPAVRVGELPAGQHRRVLPVGRGAGTGKRPGGRHGRRPPVGAVNVEVVEEPER